MVKLNGIAVAIYFAFSLIILVCALVFIRLRLKTKIKPFLVGGLTWLLFATMLEGSVHGVVLSIFPGLRENTLAFAIYGGLMAGIFEELGRYLAVKVFFKRDMENDKNALAYAAGHGGFEALVLVGLTMVSNIVLSVLINTGGADVILASVPAEAGTELNTMFGQLAASTPADFLLGMLERGVAIVLHLSMSVFVWFSVKKCKWLLYPAAVFIHALADFMAVILAKALPLWSVELILCAFAVLAALLARVVWKKYARPSESTNG